MARLSRPSKGAISLVGFQDWKSTAHRASRHPSAIQTLFVARLADISEESARQTKGAAGARYLLFPEEMPVEALASRLSLLDIRNDHRLHVARQQESEQIFQIIFRLLSGVSRTNGSMPIVDAWMENDDLVVLLPTFERLAVPMAKLKNLLGEDSMKLKMFEIDEDGSFLYWRHADVHLGWEQLLQLIDPQAALAAKQKTAAFNRRYGAAIRRFRQERGISQTEIGGLTDRHLRRIEQGQLAATKASLDALSAAHGMKLSEYMQEIASRLS